LEKVNNVSHDETQNKPCCSKTLADVQSTSIVLREENNMSNGFNQLYVIFFFKSIKSLFITSKYVFHLCIIAFSYDQSFGTATSSNSDIPNVPEQT